MKKLSMIIAGVIASAPFAANAAGTYYTGGYQSPQTQYTTTTYAGRQQYYNQNYNNRTGYTTAANQNPNARYTVGGQTMQSGQPQQQQRQPASNSGKKSGFYLDGGISREMAQWNFELKESGSKLNYGDISWNVFDANAGYIFDLGNTQLQLGAGIKYGMQSGESAMVDDDISNGGYFITEWVKDLGGGNYETIGEQIGHALSVGTSDGGSMMGFNIGLGLTDFFSIGKMKITPSVGYRHFSYELKTSQNFGLSVDTAACFTDESGEMQCDPAVVIYYDNDTKQIIWRQDPGANMEVGSGAEYIDTAGTYYYQQPGTSHSYEVAWAGPYAALDMVYDINQNNAVDAHLEIGLPSYTSTGDQPYRFDWQHPKSVEDTAGMGGALHFGLGANWKTAITDSIMFTVGLTYDYYSVSGADAKTYLNEGYYVGIYNEVMTQWGGTVEDLLATGSEAAQIVNNILSLEESCPGWVCSADGEVDSFYKSMGIRVGFAAKF